VLVGVEANSIVIFRFRKVELPSAPTRTRGLPNAELTLSIYPAVEHPSTTTTLRSIYKIKFKPELDKCYAKDVLQGSKVKVKVKLTL
jgi:hypothetical protein